MSNNCKLTFYNFIHFFTFLLFLLIFNLYPRVSLRGEQSEDAVLCTQSKTYSIKFVGTSNSVFLIPPVDNLTLYENSEDGNKKDNHKSIVAVIKVAPGNMELVEVAPRLDKLKLLLLESPYSSREELEFEGLEEMDRSITKRMYRWDDLVDKVQASENELRSGLQAFSAVEIDGYWRLVDEKYMGTILIMLLHNSVLNDWSLDALNEDEVVSTLVSDGFPFKLSQHCLHVFGSKVDEGSVRKSLWRLDERRVCVHFAREILVEGKRKMDNFMEEWKLKVPKGMHADFEMLEGEVLTEKLGVESWVHAFSVSSLPSTPAERFSILFKERPKWEQKDLLPYIRFCSSCFSFPLLWNP